VVEGGGVGSCSEGGERAWHGEGVVWRGCSVERVWCGEGVVWRGCSVERWRYD